MKIAMITFSCAFNYGAVLQTYGLYSYLKNRGHEIYVIDYIPDRYNLDAENYADMAIKRTRLWKYIPFSKTVWKKTRLAQMKQNRANFRQFLEKNIELTHKYFSFEELSKDVPDADLYITGSDRVWNPDFVWEGLIDKPYYFAFLSDEAKKISYASSFGKSKLTDSELEIAKKYLSKYNYLSVREKTGVDVIKAMGLDAVEVADPTVLAGREVFSELAKKNSWMDMPYMVLFQITFHQELYEACKSIANKNGLKLILLIPDVFQASNLDYEGKIVLPSVEEWIGYLENAAYVVTDSFHATVFSIMFERPFSSYAMAGYNGRIYNILNKLDLDKRILLKADISQLEADFEIEIDFNIVKEKFYIWKKESGDWLNKVVEDQK